MKRIALFLLALFTIVSCKPSDKYTGEPLLKLRFTVDGEPYSWEDWGRLMKVPGADYFDSESCGVGLQPLMLADSSRLATFFWECEKLKISITNNQPYFVADSIYTIPAQRDSCSFCLLNPRAASKGGWYSFSRKVSEPYGCYTLSFSFDCADGNGNT